MPAKTTVSSEYYVHLFWIPLQWAIWDMHPDLARSELILHQDNVTVHVSQLVNSTLQELGIETQPHPPWQYVTSCYFQMRKISCME